MHECPDCGSVCHCNGDIEDMEHADNSDCVHFLKADCAGEDSDDDYPAED